MIPIGIMAAQVVEPGSGVSLPDGAVAHIDFVNEFYYADGAERSISEILTSYDEAEISGSGARIASDSTMRPRMAGVLLTQFAGLFASGCTVVMEFSAADTSGIIDLPQFLLTDNASDVLADYYAQLYGTGGTELHFFDRYEVTMLSAGITGSGTQKVAFTIARPISPAGNSEWALSINGETALTQAIEYDNSLAAVTLGGFGPNPAYAFSFAEYFIRSITLYPAKTPAELPALSFLGSS